MQTQQQTAGKSQIQIQNILTLSPKPGQNNPMKAEIRVVKHKPYDDQTFVIKIYKHKSKGALNECDISKKLKAKQNIAEDLKFLYDYLVKVYQVEQKDEDDNCQRIIITMHRYQHTLQESLSSKHCARNRSYELAKTLLSLMIAITACRKLQIIHGDLKPQNIFVHTPNSFRHIVLGDFGCSYSQLNENRSLGTHYFMSPQMYLQFASNCEHKRTEHQELSDMFSLGVILAMINNSTEKVPVEYLFDADLKLKVQKIDQQSINQQDPKKLQELKQKRSLILLQYYQQMVKQKPTQKKGRARKLAYLTVYQYKDQKNTKIMKLFRKIISGLVQKNFKHRTSFFQLYKFIMDNKNVLYSLFQHNQKEKKLIQDFQHAFQIEKKLQEQYQNEVGKNPRDQNRLEALRRLRCYGENKQNIKIQTQEPPSSESQLAQVSSHVQSQQALKQPQAV